MVINSYILYIFSKGDCDFNAIIIGTSCNTSAFTCMWLPGCCEKIQCSISSFSTTSCEITCDSGTGFHHCIIDYEPGSVSNMEQTYINITFANNHLPNNQHPCSCYYVYNFTPINCSIMGPTQTTLLSNTEVLATTIPYSTTTTTTTTTTTVTNTSIVSVVVPAVTVATLLCISIIATGSALLCALCVKKRKQDLATLHSDSKDQQKYNA